MKEILEELTKRPYVRPDVSYLNVNCKGKDVDVILASTNYGEDQSWDGRTPEDPFGWD